MTRYRNFFRVSNAARWRDRVGGLLDYSRRNQSFRVRWEVTP